MRLKPLKHFCIGGPEYGLNVSADRYVETGVRLIRTTDINADGQLASSEAAVYLDPSQVARDALLQDGDLLLSRSGTLGRAFLAFGVGHAAYAGYLVRFRPSARTDPRYLWYCAQSQVMQHAISANAIQSTIGNFNGEKYANVALPTWPLGEQRAISNYLDRETARIDAVIAARKLQFGLFKERRLSVAQEAIDARSPSSVPLRRVVSKFVDYRGATPDKAESGVPLITASNVSDGAVDFSAGEQFVAEDVYWSWMRRGFPEPGDVLLTTEAPLGEVAAITDPRVALAQRIILLKPDRSRIDPEFLRVSLMSPRVQADLLSRASGSTVWGIRSDRLRDVLLSVPGHGEQRDVVRSWIKAEHMYSVARTRFHDQLRLLAERRQALITAAVTGQVQVAVAA